MALAIVAYFPFNEWLIHVFMLHYRPRKVFGRTLDFYADGELIGSADTNSDGVATLRVPPRYRGGSHEFEARFQGDSFYLASSGRAAS